MSAGQIDALYVDKAGLYYLIDFKRVERKNVLDPTKRATQQGSRAHTAYLPLRTCQILTTNTTPSRPPFTTSCLEILMA